MMGYEMICTTKENQWVKALALKKKPDSISSTLMVLGESEITWEGFGGCFNELSMLALQKLSQKEQDKIYDQLFSPEEDGLRFNFCRLPIGASDYAKSWYSYDECEGDYKMEHFSIERDKELLLPYLKEALKRNKDIHLFASPWCPPTWMKTKKAYNCGTLIQTKENLTAYALYLCKYIEAYQKQGITINQLHVQNEPVSEQRFPSCIWTGEELKNFIGQYLGPMMAERGITTKIWLGTLNGPETDFRAPYTRYDHYANLVLHDEAAYSFIEGVSYQWAGKYALQITKNSFPEKKYIQSENECGDGKNTWQYANYIFEMMHHYISNGVCAYIYWNMVLENEGISTWGWKQNSLISVDGSSAHYNYEYYVMKHFSRYVHKGAKVLQLSGHLSGNAIGFLNPDQTRVLVVQNPFDKTLEFTFEGNQIVLEASSINTILCK